MSELHQYGYYKVAAAIPVIRVADVEYNKTQILELVQKAKEQGAVSLLAFPELCLTGATCGDLFLQTSLIKRAKKALVEIASQTVNASFPILIGSPLEYSGRLYNAYYCLFRGECNFIIPKQILSLEEKKYFCTLPPENWDYIDFTQNQAAYFTNAITLYDENSENFIFSVEIGEDSMAFPSPSKLSQLHNCGILVNPYAIPAKIGYSQARKEQLCMLSRMNQDVRISVGAAYGESTTDSVYAGQSFIIDNGIILAQSNPYATESQLITALVDVDKINALKRQAAPIPDSIRQPITQNKIFGENTLHWYSTKESSEEMGYSEDFENIANVENWELAQKTETSACSKTDVVTEKIKPLLGTVPKFPFIPQDALALENNCTEIIELTALAMQKRFSHIQNKSAVIGVSGGLDSTLALLLLVYTYQKMKKSPKEIIGVRMPGFGTGSETYHNSCKLMQLLGITEREVDIKASVLQHLKDIEHSPENHDTTYENAQARERTQILMDIANQSGGLVIGTGDLSELALGFCTYNGDHMSMYSINASTPKTLIPYVIRSLARRLENPELNAILEKIIDTPISPELLPPNAEQQILQKTEELIGPYALHDFFLYNMLRYHFTPKKIRALAEKAFADVYSIEEIDKWIRVFYRRFFSQQFKRNCLPDGPALGSVSLFSTFKMPSDALANLWLEDLNNSI